MTLLATAVDPPTVRGSSLAIFLLTLGASVAASCAHGAGGSGPAPPPTGSAPLPVATVPIPPPRPPADVPAPTSTAAAPNGQPPPKSVPEKPISFRCHLPAPKLSDDPCGTDADCGVSAPCHAPACVARAKSNPADASTMCTRKLVCNSADANRCGCYEGRCALIPPEH